MRSTRVLGPVLVAGLATAGPAGRPRSNPGGGGHAPDLAIRGFTSVDFPVKVHRLPHTFPLGQFDLFVTSALSENWSFLAEWE